MNSRSKWIPVAASLVLGCVVAVLLATQPGQETKGTKDYRSQLARAFAHNAPDAPLALQIPQPESIGVDDYSPEVEVMVTNISTKDVSAYAIRYSVVCNGQSRPGGAELNQSSTARFIMRPSDTRSLSVGGVHYSLPIDRIVVSLDFVEFTDGTAWGPDEYSSKEALAGMRTGARTMSLHLLNVFTGEGAGALSAELQRAGTQMKVSAEKSEKWREGFERGVAFIRERAIRDIKTFSSDEVQRVLNLPIDALDEIKGK